MDNNGFSANQTVINNSPVPSVGKPAKMKGQKNKKKVCIILFVMIIVALLIGLGIFIFIKKDYSPDSEEAYIAESSVTPNDGSPETELVNTDEAIANSQEAIDMATDPKEKLSKQLELASLYIAINQLDNAETLLNSLDTSSFDNEDFFRFYNVSGRLAEARGDIEKRNEYNNLAINYRNLLHSQ